MVAANVDPAEADLTPIEPSEIVAAAGGAPAGSVAAQTGTPQTAEVREKNQRIWWYLLAAGLLLLGLDTLISNRLSRA